MSNIWPESGARPSDGKDGDDAFGANTVGTENVASAHSTTSHDQTAQAETVLQQFKREGVQLNTYEKKLLSTVVNPASISVNFSDLVLPAQTKLLLQTLTVLPIVRPTYFEKGILSRHSMSGVLLFGPPGTGKTLLAKALAKHSSARFMSVALSDIYDKYVGEGEKNVKAIFTLARKVKPCVVFIDEVDALFGRRGGVGDQGARREVMNEFMSEWDGLLGDNQGLVIVGATNRPFDLDDAILRRMPRRILVDLPKQAQRQQILALHLRDESLSPTLDLAHWAARTEKYSGSDLKNLCIAAALARIRDAVGGDEGLETLVISSRPATDSDSSDIPKSPQTKAASLTTDKIDVLPPLDSSHFETAIKQVAASLTDEMQTLIELRKWDQMYGEKKDGASKKVGWGFSHQ
ncbi:P-loop containing nucleoside triphosphate hydrolase protein [Powellomyces hirtus]|nr:P-loop containing nucleoside triphosphate hydrolase protein [Powellomyces hirtus]